MSISASQPETTPVATGRTAQTMGSCAAALTATWACKAARSANGPYEHMAPRVVRTLRGVPQFSDMPRVQRLEFDGAATQACARWQRTWRPIDHRTQRH